jgi:hypothetical protein
VVILRRIQLFFVFVLLISGCSGRLTTEATSTATLFPPTPPTILLTKTSLPPTTPELLPTKVSRPRVTIASADATAWAKSGCIKSFAEFALPSQESIRMPEPEIVFPLPPWQFEAEISHQQIDGFSIFSVSSEAARSIDGHQEIWLTERLMADDGEKSDRHIFLVYYPITKKTNIIPAAIGDTGTFVKDLFVMEDGSVWGKIVWDITDRAFKLDKAPVLSKFNENTRRFEFAPGVLEIQLFHELTGDGSSWPIILLDTQGVFWILVDKDGLYRYDPFTRTTEKQTDLSTFSIFQAALAPDRSIYFETYDARRLYERLVEGSLFQFNPKTRSIVPLNIPVEPWPVFYGMLVDHKDRLWLGASGFREPVNQWYLIHPNPQEIFKHLGDIFWAPPKLMLESSNGRLWYQKFLEGDTTGEGTAWYNPQTGEGCMFTNIAANIIEDSEQQLWLVADEKLYKYVIK